jgi:hypothetical protein
MKILARGIARILLRFMLFYWICFAFPFPLDLIGLPFQFVEPAVQPDWMKTARQYYATSLGWISTQESKTCQWVGEKILGVEVIIQPTGSGDTMRGYVGCLCATGVALVLTLFWTLVTFLVRRWRPDWQGDRLLHAFVRVFVRFYLCEMLFSYGFGKVIPLQFAEPNSSRLAQQLGDMSPMGLLWTFMGFSTPYQMFTGAVEVVGGILLTTRRTTFLGAMVTMVAMTQIFLLNMCFDVPVKLYSFHYLVMALFLAAPDLPRVFSVLIMGNSAEARPFGRLFGRVGAHRCAIVLRTLIVVVMIGAQVKGSYKFWNDMYGGPPLPVTGRWDVVSFQLDKKETDKTDEARWTWIDFSNKAYMRLAGIKPPNLAYKMTWNTEEKKLKLGKFSTPMWSAQFSYDVSEPDKLVLNGSMNGKEVSATLKPAPEKRYELMNRGFHWVQELPYNR